MIGHVVRDLAIDLHSQIVAFAVFEKLTEGKQRRRIVGVKAQRHAQEQERLSPQPFAVKKARDIAQNLGNPIGVIRDNAFRRRRARHDLLCRLDQQCLRVLRAESIDENLRLPVPALTHEETAIGFDELQRRLPLGRFQCASEGRARLFRVTGQVRDQPLMKPGNRTQALLRGERIQPGDRFVGLAGTRKRPGPEQRLGDGIDADIRYIRQQGQRVLEAPVTNRIDIERIGRKRIARAVLEDVARDLARGVQTARTDHQQMGPALDFAIVGHVRDDVGGYIRGGDEITRGLGMERRKETPVNRGTEIESRTLNIRLLAGRTLSDGRHGASWICNQR